MEIHEEVTLEVQVRQPQINQQQPHPPHGAIVMVILGPSFNDFKPLATLLPTKISERENVGDLLGLHMKDMGMSLKTLLQRRPHKT
jgi:hypothetical protein